MSRFKKHFHRKPSQVKPERVKVLIVCEDEEFSVKYFRDLCKDLDINSLVKVTGDSGSAPQSVIDYSIELAKEKAKDVNYAYDYVYCVIDKDSHAKYSKVVRNFQEIVTKHFPDKKGTGNPKFKLITNVRCFEVWILLHLTYTAKSFADQKSLLKEIKGRATKDCKQGKSKNSIMLKLLADNSCKKNIFQLDGINYSLYEITKNSTDTAINNARKLRAEMQKHHGTNDVELQLNADPYTEIDLLIYDLRKLKP